jgi:hypothetical protein
MSSESRQGAHEGRWEAQRRAGGAARGRGRRIRQQQRFVANIVLG